MTADLDQETLDTKEGLGRLGVLLAEALLRTVLRKKFLLETSLPERILQEANPQEENLLKTNPVRAEARKFLRLEKMNLAQGSQKENWDSISKSTEQNSELIIKMTISRKRQIF